MEQFPSPLVMLSPRPLLQGAGNADALENVIPAELADGAGCWVIDQQQMYFLNKKSTAAVSAPDVIATAFGAAQPGRWLRQPGTGGGASVAPLSNVLYVDQGSVQATEDGSIAAPYKTITDAIAAAATDYTLLITPGDYTAEGALAGINKRLTLQSIRNLLYPSSLATFSLPPVRIASLSINSNDCEMLELDGIQVLGAITQTVVGTTIFQPKNCILEGAVTLPGCETFAVFTEFNAAVDVTGSNLNMQYGRLLGNVTATAFFGTNVSLFSGITFSGDANVDAFTNYMIVTFSATVTGTKTVLGSLTP